MQKQSPYSTILSIADKLSELTVGQVRALLKDSADDVLFTDSTLVIGLTAHLDMTVLFKPVIDFCRACESATAVLGTPEGLEVAQHMAAMRGQWVRSLRVVGGRYANDPLPEMSLNDVLAQGIAVFAQYGWIDPAQIISRLQQGFAGDSALLTQGIEDLRLYADFEAGRHTHLARPFETQEALPESKPPASTRILDVSYDSVDEIRVGYEYLEKIESALIAVRDASMTCEPADRKFELARAVQALLSRLGHDISNADDDLRRKKRPPYDFKDISSALRDAAEWAVHTRMYALSRALAAVAGDPVFSEQALVTYLRKGLPEKAPA